MDTTIAVPAQYSRAERTPPDHQDLPASFDPCRCPILALHWFGIVPLFVPVSQERDDAGVEVEAA